MSHLLDSFDLALTTINQKASRRKRIRKERSIRREARAVRREEGYKRMKDEDGRMKKK
jgi:hypothetical protein